MKQASRHRICGSSSFDDSGIPIATSNALDLSSPTSHADVSLTSIPPPDPDAVGLKRVANIMGQMRARVLFSGHSHSLQHIQRRGVKNYQWHQFVSGGGGSYLIDAQPKAKSHVDVRFARVMHGFLAVTVTHETMHVTFVDKLGEEVYNTTIACIPPPTSAELEKQERMRIEKKKNKERAHEGEIERNIGEKVRRGLKGFAGYGSTSITRVGHIET